MLGGTAINLCSVGAASLATIGCLELPLMSLHPPLLLLRHLHPISSTSQPLSSPSEDMLFPKHLTGGVVPCFFIHHFIRHLSALLN